MLKYRKQMEFKLLAVVMAIAMTGPLVLVSPARATDNASFCRNYASTAVDRNRQNISRRCGYSGNRWSNDYKGHYNWCTGVSRSTANGETNARTRDLERCGGEGGSNSFCRNYASTAVDRNRQNISRRCGYSGNRWSNDYKGHYNWCTGVSRSTANGETNARTRDLERCGGEGGNNSFCRNYASTAVDQNRQNTSRSCGYSGNRWSNDYKGHYNWCTGVSRSTANGETDARVRNLQRCQTQPTQYKSRWDKIDGSGGAWTTGWVYDQDRQVCGHYHSGCRCGGGYCGDYRSGQTTSWWPQGCSGPRWTIRCTSVPQ